MDKIPIYIPKGPVNFFQDKPKPDDGKLIEAGFAVNADQDQSTPPYIEIASQLSLADFAGYHNVTVQQLPMPTPVEEPVKSGIDLKQLVVSEMKHMLGLDHTCLPAQGSKIPSGPTVHPKVD